MTPKSSSNTIARQPPLNSNSSQKNSTSPTSIRGVESSVDGGNELRRSRPKIPYLKVEINNDPSPAETRESSGASSVGTPLWRLIPPSRGRPQLHCDIPSLSSLNSRDVSAKDSRCKSMPMPERPRKRCFSVPKNVGSFSAASTKKDTRPKPYVLEVPATAPHHAPNSHSDFFPWIGNHPEDQFSESSIRQGFIDKAQTTQNEMGSARSLLLPALKQKSGLQTLSSIFTNILTQRRSNGQITSASTFKPPPRVTVTDNKREMWLKDLANPTISLRRLSRSIPHGIRGKGLLEQSLGKNIPIERAVWLAKCVGANELRSFRRKGVSGTYAIGGETKWIRDFTICVEQFLESIIGACGETDFKAKICYAVRLATHFHAECLLDREHYMEWLVSSLESTPQARLPVWLLVTQIYWKELLRYRKYGRRISNALLNQLAEIIDHPDNDILAPLTERLTLLLKELVIWNNNNFVAPKVWAKHRELIYSCIGGDDEQLSTMIDYIDARNIWLSNSGSPHSSTSQQNLIRILDRCLTTQYTNSIARECWEVDKDKKALIQTVLDWSTSSYRPGKIKIFVGARLLRSWKKKGENITENVLDFLDSAVCETGRNKSDFYHLISELSRSGHFSTPKYIEWIIARGDMLSSKTIGSDGPCALRLLAELPRTNLSESISEIRLTLLSRANSLLNEEDCVRNCLSLICRDLPGMQTRLDSDLELTNDLAEEIEEYILNISRTIKSEIGLWLREKVGLQTVESINHPMDKWNESSIQIATSKITLSDFHTVRQYLENIGDFSILADVLKLVSSSKNTDVLASCADTLNFHLEIFAAIGASNELFDILISRLRILTEESDSAPRSFIVALVSLSSKLDEKVSTVQQLAYVLGRSHRKIGIDAFSPKSDHMTGIENLDLFTDDIEKILSSEDKLDHKTMKQLFQKITSLLEASWGKSSEQQRNCGALLATLRSFDIQLFDTLIANWIQQYLYLTTRPSLIHLFAPLIYSGCLTLEKVLEICSENMQGQARVTEFTNHGGIHLEILDLLLPTKKIFDILSAEEAYRFRIRQFEARRHSPAIVITALRLVFELPSPSLSTCIKDSNPQLLLESKDVQELLHSAILFNTDIFVQNLLLPILKGSNAVAKAKIDKSIDRLILSLSSARIITAELLLSIAGELTLPFCLVKLTSIFRTKKDSESSEDIETFSLAIESAIFAGNITWTNIIPHFDSEISQYLQQKAEAQFLSLLPSSKIKSENELDSLQRRVTLGKNLLLIINLTSDDVPTTHIHNNNASLILDIAAALDSLGSLLKNSQSHQVKNSIIESWIPLLYSFILAHIFLFESNEHWPENRAKVVMAVTAIFLQLRALDFGFEDVEGLIEQSYDLALHLVDTLPDDTRQNCIQSLHDAVSIPHISYLFSCTGTLNKRLVLLRRDQKLDSKTTESPCDEMPPESETSEPFIMRRWEMLGEPTPNVGENDTSLSLTLFGSRRG
ncbi:Mediator of RNA polymerase II transcription subunit 12 [Podosphaera aphanis]|nr:Mediator of RNA polymerase II transcription subunit 12 [Podosphaera aphanis]